MLFARACQSHGTGRGAAPRDGLAHRVRRGSAAEARVRRPVARPITGLLAALLSVMALSLASPSATASETASPALRVAFEAWKVGLFDRAERAGIRRETVVRELGGVGLTLTLPDLAAPAVTRQAPSNRGQAEFTRPPQAYLDPKTLARLAEQGRRLAVTHRATLSQIERRLGVAPEVVLAIWGRETAFGSYQLKHNAIDVLTTLAFTGRRKEMFEEELIAALRMIDLGVAPRTKLRSSWAGAIGLTQFMPTEFFSTAYDLDGDGVKDLWSPPDALASAANQLKLKGWMNDRPWGYEVRLSPEVTCGMAGPTNARVIGDWVALGLTRVDGTRFSARELEMEAYLLVPGGTYGPVFLVTENYVVFRRYNMSDLYALFVGDLANRIAGRGTFRTAWAELEQLSGSDLAEIQQRLKDRGFAITIVDGKLGSNTRSQIGLYQRSVGLPTDCWPSRSLLSHLRRADSRPSQAGAAQ